MFKLEFCLKFILFVLFFNSLVNIIACTNILVTPGASIDASSIISYSADSHNLYGYLKHHAACQFDVDEKVKIIDWETGKYHGEIPQVAKTYSVIGNMNEYQVTIAETTFGGREELIDTLGIIDYGNLIDIALQRSKTAREAISVMTSLVEKYGYCSSGESFSIADANEVWIMEMIGKGIGNTGAFWVALKVPDGFITAHANQARINQFPQKNEDMCLFSSGMIEFAKENGYYKGKDKEFSFCDAFAPLDFEALRFCEARVWSVFRRVDDSMDQYIDYIKGDKEQARIPLWIKPKNKVGYRDVIMMMRDHFEDTELDLSAGVGAGPYHVPYRFRPLVWEIDSIKYFHERAIATQQTAFSFVGQMRNWLPNAIGGLLWFGVDDAATSVYIPIYCGIIEVPDALREHKVGLIQFSWNSAFWVFNWVANMSYSRYNYMIKDICKIQTRLEDKFALTIPAIDQAAQSLYNYNKEDAKNFLTDYCKQQSVIVMNEWQNLGQFLMVKYLDGNIHEEQDGVFKTNAYGKPQEVKHPGYSEEYYRNIIDQNCNKYKIKE